MRSILVFSFLALLFSSCIKEPATISDGSQTEDPDDSSSTPILDPLLSEAWHFNNTAQNSFSDESGVAGEDSSVLSAQNQGYNGSGIRIAIADNGTETTHEDLKSNELEGEHRNYSNSNSSLWRGSLPVVSQTNPENAHGTAVAGLAAAAGMNGLGSRGTGYGAKFAAFKILGFTETTYSSALAKQIDVHDGNFDIFNFSFGTNGCQFFENTPSIFDAIDLGTTELRSGKGVAYIKSSGNEYLMYRQFCSLNLADLSGTAGNTNFDMNMSHPGYIVVGAINAQGIKASYSTPGSGLWVTAPGGEDGNENPAMITTDLSSCNRGFSRKTSISNNFEKGWDALNRNCNYTSNMNGTSSAAPVLSGVTALIMQANPLLTIRDIKHILASTSDKVDYSLSDILEHPLGSTYELAGHDYDLKWTSNAAGYKFSNWYGFGRVNALEAVLMASTYNFSMGEHESTVHPITKKSYYDSGLIDLEIPDEDSNGTSTTLNVLHNFFIESVQVEFNSNHPLPSDVGLSLISPQGTESRLLLINSNIYAVSFPENSLFLTNAFYGEPSLGTWTLKVVDGKSGDTGSVTHWSLRINGHRIEGDGSSPLPPTQLTHSSTFSQSNQTPLFSFTPSTSNDVVRYELSIGTSSGGQEVLKWASIGLSHAGLLVDQLELDVSETYFINIRAIDAQENASSVLISSWQVLP